MLQRIEIPENSIVYIQDGCVCIESKEQKEETKPFDPKNGDFCTLKYSDSRWIYIFKSIKNDRHIHHCLFGCYDGFYLNSWLNLKGELTPSTSEEKQLLLSEIDKAGYVWNAEMLRIEKKRWRAEKNCNYYILHTDMDIFNPTETKNILDDTRYDSGNYFKTEEQATEAGELIKELFFHYHENDETLNKIKELLCANND